MELFQHGSHIELVEKWFGWGDLSLIVFVIFWDGLLFMGLFMGTSGITESSDLKTILILLIFVAIGVLLTYVAVAVRFNRTHIFVSREKIVVRHGPIPWPGNKELDAPSLKQLYTKESFDSEDSSCGYEVHAVVHDGRDIELVHLKTSKQALYVKQEIEKYLGIEDRRATGQIGG